MSPYLAKDPRPDLSQGMSLKAVEEIEASAQEAQKYALEAESLSQQAQQASQEALAAIERKDRETVTEVQGGRAPRGRGEGGRGEVQGRLRRVQEGARGRARHGRRGRRRGVNFCPLLSGRLTYLLRPSRPHAVL